MTSFDLSQFVLIPPPKPAGDVLAAHLMADNKMQLNAKLNDHMQQRHFLVYFCAADSAMVLIPQDVESDGTHARRKNGLAQADFVCAQLQQHGISLPVRYEFEWVEAQHGYIGWPNLRYRFRMPPRRKINKPRTKDLHHMMPTR